MVAPNFPAAETRCALGMYGLAGAVCWPSSRPASEPKDATGRALEVRSGIVQLMVSGGTRRAERVRMDQEGRRLTNFLTGEHASSLALPPWRAA